jgi:hypothetical protein
MLKLPLRMACRIPRIEHVRLNGRRPVPARTGPARRSSDAREECWQIFYGDVCVGTIAKRIGIPRDQALWGWSCGFYPGSFPAIMRPALAQPLTRRAPLRGGMGPVPAEAN